MKIELNLNQDINTNANYFFQKSKKLKNKIPGVENIIEKTKKEILDFEERKENYIAKKKKEETLKSYKKKIWYEKFRWTFTKNGVLVVIGKDSGTNEILIKKYMEKNDLVFHTSSSGSPFGLVKEGKNKLSKEELEEVGSFISCFSAQWKAGFGTADCFWVFPEQVSKKAESGEYMAKGAFMIRGNKNILKNIPLQICLGIKKETITTEEGELILIEEPFSGSKSSCKKYCGKRFLKFEPGNDNYKKLNKEIQKRLKFHIDELPRFLPNNGRILKK